MSTLCLHCYNCDSSHIIFPWEYQTNPWIFPSLTLVSPTVYYQFSNQSALSVSFLLSQFSNVFLFYSESNQNLESGLLGPTEFKPDSPTSSLFDLISYNHHFHWYILTKHSLTTCFSSNIHGMFPPQGLCTWRFLFRGVLLWDICIAWSLLYPLHVSGQRQ